MKNMAYTEAEKSLITDLLRMLDELSISLDRIGENPKAYPAFRKVKNIVESRDSKGMKNVKKHLMMDFRMIDDRQLDDPRTNSILKEIYSHVSEHRMFSS
ncbi:Uncharacterised protein [BD1-7 clade bacterium]|uniref:Uncharacterized protein n=1 Tax=BD1-7 clade bacterium TaxID=2029982 RepID=A0A5S9PGB1_9GAMM|nr:Uncharacterised protein [BD1-7 clade bacterium]CAA0102876.1 Uncharacterised protein [BD1-7 clade bacterium]